MTPAEERLLRRCAALERRLRNARSMLSYARAEKDEWQAKAVARARKINSLRSSVYSSRRSRDLWKHRALRKGDL